MTVEYTRADPYAAELAAQEDAGLSQGPQTLSDMGEALLEVVRAAAVARGVTLPGRQIVYPSPIPADCEQVAVLFTGWNLTPPPGGPVVCLPGRWIGSYSVTITRCTPAMPRQSGRSNTVAPTPDKMIEAARLASADAEVFLEVLNRLGEIGAEVGVVCQAPSGGFQTVELNVQLLPVGSFL